jgi:hypothetical protein
MINKTKTMFLIVAIAAAIGLAAATVFTINLAYAAISPANTGCTNNGGNQPGGQQPTCSGSGLTQQTENQNPAGSAPPGQNK